MGADPLKNLTSKLDDLLSSEDLSAIGGVQGLNDMIRVRQRKLAHDKAKGSQPALGVAGLTNAQSTLQQFFHAPLDPVERDAGGMDDLLQTFAECLDGGSAEDALFAALRIVRKCWAWNPHLGGIGPEPPAELRPHGGA